MPQSPAPIELTQPIAARAAQLARSNIRDRGWSERAANSISPVSRPGQAGLHVSLDYILFQNSGIRPFVMGSLEGKTIPIKDASGLHFVRATNVGQPGWVTLPGGIKKWRDARWKHPGLRPQKFLEHSIEQAITEARPGLSKQILDFLFRRKSISPVIEGPLV